MYKCFIKIISIMFLICMLAFIGGCEKKHEPSPKKEVVSKKISVAKKKKVSQPDGKKQNALDVKEKSSGITGDKATSQESESEEEDVYNPEGKINPFVSTLKTKQLHAVDGSKIKKKRRGHLTPLEKVDISQLTLLGTILASSGNRAMVAESNGKGYVVTEGTYVGIYSGRVAQILKDEIIVEEEVENILGKISIRKRSLKIKRPPGE